MKKNAKRQNYQEIEAKTHQSTATAKVVALPLPAQPLETTTETVATEVQPPATALQFPATQQEVADALPVKVSRQQVGKYLKLLRTVYKDFPHLKIETGSKITELGFEAIASFQKSDLQGQAYLDELRSRLQQETVNNSPVSAAIVQSNPQSYAIKPVGTSSLARYDAQIAHSGEIAEQVKEMGQVYAANNKTIAEQYLRSRIAQAKELRAMGDRLFLQELLGGQNELAETLANEGDER